MNLTLMLVGAGEHTSLVDGKTDSYLRFCAADGSVTNLQCSQEQLAALLDFAVTHGAQVPVQPARTPAPVAAVPEPPRTQYEADPNIPDEEEDAPVRLRGAVASASPFASPDDDL